MKKTFLLFSLLLLAYTVHAQYDRSKQEYLNKSTNQKTTAKILFGAGGAMMATALLVMVDDVGGILNPADNVNNGLGEALTVAGLVCMGSSIPLFIAAHKNKRKGLSLSFQNQPTRQVRYNSIVSKHVPAIGVTLRF